METAQDIAQDSAQERRDLPARVTSVCRDLLTLPAGARVLVAVSGGADSTALACLLAATGEQGLPLELVLGHVDHGWRGADEAAADAGVVRDLAERLSVPVAFSPPPPAGTPRTEDAARRWRYRCLSELAREHDCPYVATGHHAGDQAETFLMRLLRGSGPVGLAGIPPRRSLQPGDLTVLRPLLDLEPASLRRWLSAQDVAWRDDPTNRDLTRDRAAVRARLARRSTAARPQAPTLAALARRLRRRLEMREARIAAAAAGCVRHHPEAAAVELPRSWITGLYGQDLTLALRHAGAYLQADADGPWFTRRHVDRFEDLLVRGGDLDLPRGLLLHVGGRTVWLARRAPPTPQLPYLRHTEVDRATFDLAAFLAAGAGRSAALDADRLGPQPRVRLLRPEDRFTPYGREARRPVRIQRWLSRHGVPGLCRRGQLVLEGAEGIAWVVDRRVDARHAVTQETRRVALIRLEQPSGV